MKKGLIELKIEIDYDLMVTPEKLETLHGFTGEKDPDKLMTMHMKNLAEKIEGVLKELPLMRYDMKGDFISLEDIERMTQTQQSVSDGIEEVHNVPEVVEEVHYVEESSDHESEVIDVPVEEAVAEEESYILSSDEDEEAVALSDEDAVKYMEWLDASLEKTSMENGMPVGIKVSDLMHRAMRHSAPLEKCETEDCVVKHYNGFPVTIEGMEELFVIDYKSYTTNQVESHGITL